MKKFLFLLIIFGLGSFLHAQSLNMKELEKRRKDLQKQIEQSESLLRTTKQDVGSQLSSLTVLTNQITERKKYVEAIEKDMVLLNREIGALEQQLKQLEKELFERKMKYETSLQNIQKNRSVEEKLLFIFSAKTLSQTYRRLRYMQEYASYQRRQGEEIIRKQEQIKEKQEELLSVREEKIKLQKDNEEQRLLLQNQEKEKKSILATLQKKQKGLQDEIAKKRREAAKLNAQIDKLVEEEMAKMRKRAETENRKETAKSSSSKEKTVPIKKFTLSKEDRELSGSFEKNKGLLPVPITGSYRIEGHFGQYNVEGMRNVTLDNKGINIQGQKGAKARAVFNGEVSSVFQYSGLIGVLVRHGNYISVYCNLVSTSVKKGDKIKTNDIIGELDTVSGYPTLHFQLRKESTKLNPEPWIRK